MPKRKLYIDVKNWFTIVVVLVGVTHASGREPGLHVHFESFRALRLSYTDLSVLLLDVQEIIHDAAADNSKVRSDWVRVASAPHTIGPGSAPSFNPARGESEQLTLSGNYGGAAFAEAPREARSMLYEFHATNHPITNVNIRLGHSRREVTVAGTSRFQVKRLSAAIRRRLEAMEVTIVKHMFLVYGHAILYFVLFALPLLVVVRSPELLDHAIPTLIVLALYAMLCRYVMAENPMAAWFPATEIRHGSFAFFLLYTSTEPILCGKPAESRNFG